MTPRIPPISCQSWRPPNVPDEVVEVMERVCRRFRISLKDMLAHTKREPYLTARIEAIKAVAALPAGPSTPQIGRWFDGRDHTTILNALRRTRVARERLQAAA